MPDIDSNIEGIIIDFVENFVSKTRAFAIRFLFFAIKIWFLLIEITRFIEDFC